MPKAGHKRKHLIGGLLIGLEGKTMTIMARSLAVADSHATVAVAGSLYLIHKQ